MTAGETGLVVPVPEAAPVVSAHRLRLDPSAADGMPEHITLLYPFVEADAPALDALADLFSFAHAFDFALTHLGRFDSEVLYLAPEPWEPFVALTRRLVERFGVLPYGGAFPEIVPHLTIAQGGGADAAMEAEVARSLPIRSRAAEAWLLARPEAGRWLTRARFRFGAAP